MIDSSPALTIKNLKKKYRKHVALKDLNLTVPRGAIMGLIGPNGAGKTTAFAIIAGLLSADHGEIDLMGDGPFNPVKHKGRLSLLPQDAQIPGHSRVRETLIHFGRLQGLDARTSSFHADKTLEWVDLTDRAKAPVSTLSHGMIRRLAAAQAFIGSPDIVLLDEPTSGLDPQQVVRVREMIMSQRGKQTILVSSHILSEIEAACDHIAFIDHGVTTRQDSMDDLVQKSRSLTITLTRPLLSLPESLSDELPDVSFRLLDDNITLNATFTDNQSSGAMNRILIPLLLREGIDIEEIHRGGNLEKIYLEDRNNHQ